MSPGNLSFTPKLVWYIVLIGVLAGVVLTLLGIEIPVIIYVIWVFAFFILVVSVLLENRPGGPGKSKE